MPGTSANRIRLCRSQVHPKGECKQKNQYPKPKAIYRVYMFLVVLEVKNNLPLIFCEKQKVVLQHMMGKSHY